MKLILGVDAISPPLTGIGRYTWELARQYATGDYGFDALRFFSAGRWIADPSLLLSTAPKNAPRSRLKKVLSPPASLRKWRLKQGMRHSLFHSPNYFLPESADSGVVTIHDLSVFKYPETHPVERLRHFERSFESTLQRANHLITDSEAIREEVSGFFGWSKEKITAVHLGVPQEFQPYEASSLVAPLAEIGLTPGSYGLCVSTLEPRKRIDRLLDAYSELPLRLRETCQLVLAGSSGWLNDALREKIRRGEGEGWLRYLGFVPEVSLPALYAGARAFFLPSLYEGFGLPVLEALASGVPTLTSNCSSLPEVAGGAAWLVEPDNHDALREGIEKVITDDIWRVTAIQRGLDVAREMTWQKCARQTVAVYESLSGTRLRR
ncbi:glycosyltransferase family 1 protein [Paraburkholderia sp. BCC1876]|uniref:glycosyltransferase family 4 protein n=1 Tax=Paraburkholderia sp. BCC1876 TaxID=2676303 RepID=UPI0015917544|nr:glycosyltransferase family 1 protein [Paraburkholderia sp. BCC1876]